MTIAVPPITEATNWAYRGSINYSPDGTKAAGLRVFAPSCTAPLIRLETIANAIPGYKRPPDHWFLAGNLTILHGNHRDSRTHKVPLNDFSIFWLDPIALPYQVGFDAVDWLPDLTVNLYEWVGTLVEDPIQVILTQQAELQAQILALQQAIAAIPSTLEAPPSSFLP